MAGHYRIRDVNDVDQLLAAVKAISRAVGRIDRLADALEELQQPLASVRQALDIEGIRPAKAAGFRETDCMKEILRTHGVPVARSVLARSPEDIQSFKREIGLPIIVKPPASLWARSTSRRERRRSRRPRTVELCPVCTTARPGGRVRARERTCETVTVRGKVIWQSGTRYEPSPLEAPETPRKQYWVMLPREEVDAELARFHPVNEVALGVLFGAGAETAAGWSRARGS